MIIGDIFSKSKKQKLRCAKHSYLTLSVSLYWTIRVVSHMANPRVKWKYWIYTTRTILSYFSILLGTRKYNSLQKGVQFHSCVTIIIAVTYVSSHEDFKSDYIFQHDSFPSNSHIYKYDILPCYLFYNYSKTKAHIDNSTECKFKDLIYIILVT